MEPASRRPSRRTNRYAVEGVPSGAMPGGTIPPSSRGFSLTWLSPRAEPFRHLLVADILSTIQLGHAGLHLIKLPFFGVNIGGDSFSGKKGLRALRHPRTFNVSFHASEP